MIRQNLTYCGEIVREQDPDRFLLSLMAPAQFREDLWALFAFNYEIAKTRESVTEPMLGRIRLQWWREAVARIYEDGMAPDHPVVESISSIVNKRQLPRGFFDELIDAREFDMEGAPHEEMSALRHYAAQTSAPLTHLCLYAMNMQAERPVADAVSVNYALAGLLRARNFLKNQGRCLIGSGLPAKEIAGLFDWSVRPSGRFLKAMQALAKMHMRRLQKNGFDEARAGPLLFKEIRVLSGSFF